MNLYLNNLTGRISLVVLHWVTHRKVQKSYAAIWHILWLTVFYSCKVSPPKGTANSLKAVLEISSTGLKCCFHCPFPHRTALHLPKKESSKLLSFQIGGKGILKSFGSLVKQGVTLHCAACEWQCHTEILPAWMPKCKAEPSKPRFFARFSDKSWTEPNL